MFEPGVQHPSAVGLRAVSLQLLAPGEPFTTHGAVKRKLPQVDRLDVLLLRKTHCLNFFFGDRDFSRKGSFILERKRFFL